MLKKMKYDEKVCCTTFFFILFSLFATFLDQIIIIPAITNAFWEVL